jgi:hypothetical protein
MGLCCSKDDSYDEPIKNIKYQCLTDAVIEIIYADESTYYKNYTYIYGIELLK